MLIPFSITCQINEKYNAARPGDEIIKKQVEYKDPGRSGENVIWDFGQLKAINEEYTLTYSQPYLLNSFLLIGKDSISVSDHSQIVIGTEHHTMYFYENDGNNLWLLGHENPTTYLHYTKPQLVISYPTNYTQKYSDDYKAKGNYSGRIPFNIQGDVEILADAYGMMVLPSGDTLQHVMRIKTKQIIDGNTAGSNLQETYKWYAKGYRYPIFETVKAMGNEKEIFSTAFFFPPQDHYYLDTDPDNLAIIDSLWNLNHIVQEINIDKKAHKSSLSYNFFPNPVETILNIEYYLENAETVIIHLYSLDGKLIKSTSQSIRSQGLYKEQLDLSSLNPGTYILKIQTKNNYITSDKIIKK